MKQLFEVSYYDGLYNTFDIFCDFIMIFEVITKSCFSSKKAFLCPEN